MSYVPIVRTKSALLQALGGSREAIVGSICQPFLPRTQNLFPGVNELYCDANF